MRFEMTIDDCKDPLSDYPSASDGVTQDTIMISNQTKAKSIG